MKVRALYETIFDDLKENIENGNLSNGQRVQSEKELAEQYHVSRITSQKALNMLARSGYIIRMPGKGSFVSHPEQVNEPVHEIPLPKVEPNGNGHQRLIGYVVRGIGPSYGIHLLSALEAECKRHQFVLALKFAATEQEEERCINELIDLGVSGLIVVCIQGKVYSECILRLVIDHFPIVLVDRGLQGIPASYVGTDNRSAAQELTHYLLKKGKDRLCCVSSKSNHLDINVYSERERGFWNEMIRHGIIPNEKEDILYLEYGGIFQSQEGLNANIEAITRYMKAHSDKNGFMCVSYNLAETLESVLLKMNMAAGKEIVCFDCIDSSLCLRRFTHVKQNEKAMGEQAVQILARAIAGETRAQKIIVPHSLVVK